MSSILRAFAVALSLGALMLSPAGAQNSPQGNQSPPSSHSAISVADFVANPGALLTLYPLGGGSMVSDVQDLVTADMQTVDPLLSLVATANSEQKNALGTGLGLAALDLARSNPQAASAIQNALVRLNDPTLLAAYAAVTGNQRLAAAGPGAGAGGGGESATGGAGINGGIGGPTFLFPSFGTTNTADTFTFPTVTGGTPGSSPSGGPVSPSGP
jgi:hypothetical protein